MITLIKNNLFYPPTFNKPLSQFFFSSTTITNSGGAKNRRNTIIGKHKQDMADKSKISLALRWHNRNVQTIKRTLKSTFRIVFYTKRIISNYCLKRTTCKSGFFQSISGSNLTIYKIVSAIFCHIRIKFLTILFHVIRKHT